MRTQQDILNEINTAADGYQELSDLQDNTSRVAFWRAVKNVVAFAGLTLEKLFEAHLKDVQSLIRQTEPGTAEWVAGLALRYQHGDAVVVRDNLIVFPAENLANRIIKRVSVREKNGGGLAIKVAKADGRGELKPLDPNEKTAFEVYMGRVKFAGIPVEVVSLPANALKIEAEIELDAQRYETDGKRRSDGTEPVKDIIAAYLRTFPFDEPFYLSKLIDAIQMVEGVQDVRIDKAALDGALFTRKTDVPAGYMTLNHQSTISYVFD